MDERQGEGGTKTEISVNVLTRCSNMKIEAVLTRRESLWLNEKGGGIR